MHLPLEFHFHPVLNQGARVENPKVFTSPPDHRGPQEEARGAGQSKMVFSKRNQGRVKVIESAQKGRVTFLLQSLEQTSAPKGWV